MSKEMKEGVCALLNILEVIARLTKNPIDDTIIKAIKSLAGCTIIPKLAATCKKIIPHYQAK